MSLVLQTSWPPNIVSQSAELAMAQKRQHFKQFPECSRVADTQYFFLPALLCFAISMMKLFQTRHILDALYF